MKKQILELIKSTYNDEDKLKSLESIYELYEQLQYSENIDEMANSLYDWLELKYSITNINFYLFDMESNLNIPILKKGDDFALDDEMSFYFIINTHTTLNAIVSFSAISQEHFDMVNNDYAFIEVAFFQISPILQNGIMKKNHIESSSVDSVTNVYNRKYFIQRIKKITSLSHNKDESIAFLMIGIDHFKAVIDEFNYDIGDKVLIELAKVIYKNISKKDIVARLIGDEFLVALINLDDSVSYDNIAQKIIDDFSEVEVIVDEETQQVLKKTVCIGISSYPQDSNNISEVLKYSDAVLYEAKNKGRGQMAIYVEEDNSSIDLF